MGVRLVVAVTDGDWFDHLRNRPHLEEVNFWAPSARSFKALTPGELFLFKLHAPRNVIVGGGVFAYANDLPCSLAWEAFGEGNGAASLPEMRTRIARYRNAEPNDPQRLRHRLPYSHPALLPAGAPLDPGSGELGSQHRLVQALLDEDPEGLRLWEAVQGGVEPAAQMGFAEEQARYGEPTLVRPRLGQGTFRVLVTDSYQRRCAVSGEKTLPALDAAHIRPYREGGSHDASNGILMRRDIHSLFDAGYVTITPELRFEVSGRIREEFSNGRHYYALHGSSIAVPDRPILRPNRAALQWHNERVFRG